MNRPFRAALGGVLLLAGALPAPAADAEPPRPDVLLVTLDTTRADHLGCYGAPFAKTPTIDSIASRGVRFDRALAPAPLTLPSHATLLTGLVPRRHGARDNVRTRVDPSVTTLPERLSEAGYATAAFVSAAVLDRVTGLDRGFDVYDDAVRVGPREAFDHEERAASTTADAAVGRLVSLPSPRFVWVHFYDPHLPWVAPEPYRGDFADRPYDAEIAFADAQLARVLEAMSVRSRPLVIVAGDHGESLGEHGEQDHGVFLYQSTQRVPLLLAGPGIPPGRVVRENSGLVDVAPTVLDLLGLDALPDADGRSLVAELRGSGGPAPAYEMESIHPQLAYGWAPLRALVRGGLKYVEAPRAELYDLDTDPSETRNLIRARPEAARSLAEALARRVAEGAGSPIPVSADPERRARLESLGYVDSGSPAAPSSIDPKDVIGDLGLLADARRSLAAGRTEEAADRLRPVLAASPENVPALLTLGSARLRAGRTAEAIAAFRRAVAVDEGYDLAQMHLANALREAGRDDEASLVESRARYERALDLHPRRAETYQGYALLLLEHDGPAAARSLLRRARASGIADPAIETELGILEERLGSTARAREAMERAIDLNPTAVVAVEGLARLAFARGDPREAERRYAQAVALEPTFERARTLGSIRLVALDDPSGAAEAFAIALGLAPPGSAEAEEVRAILGELESLPR